METTPIRLTQLARGGGCGCKLAPDKLKELIPSNWASFGMPSALLVGVETSDDAAVYKINEHQAIVATTDFFTPIVDDPFAFGQIAATNALSDIYAMGAQPLFALAITAMPMQQLPKTVIQKILEGGQNICHQAGIPIAGGHTIDSAEPIYGLAVVGLMDPAKIKRNSGAQPGDHLILSKPLGIGIYSAAFKQDKLPEAAYQQLLQITTQLNTPGIALGNMPEVHALTDVTGFGLLGHLLEMCHGAQVCAEINYSALPKLPLALELAKVGLVTGASGRNWKATQGQVFLDEATQFGEADRHLLTDPQTSGGLLIACTPEQTEEILTYLHAAGFPAAAPIGKISGLALSDSPDLTNAPKIRVTQ